MKNELDCLENSYMRGGIYGYLGNVLDMRHQQQ